MSYNSYQLKTLLTEDKIYNLLQILGASGITKDSNGFRSSCPIHGGNNNTSFVFNPNKLLYCCYSSCNEADKEGDIIALVEKVNKCSYDDAIIYICENSEIDIKLVQSSEEFALEDLKIKIDNILLEIQRENLSEDDTNLYYGVQPVDESLLQKFLGLKDEYDFIESQGIKESTLKLFESAYNEKEKRWLLPIRSPQGELLGFDGRDVTNKAKEKWKKRKGLLKNKLLGRLDIVGEEIKKENKIILCEGKKDQMAIYEAGLKFTSCIYGSTLSKEQADLVGMLIDDEIITAFDGDKAGYKATKSLLKYCYPEYNITCLEIEDGEDPANLSSKHLLEIYENRIPIEEFLKKYEYRAKQKKK